MLTPEGVGGKLPEGCGSVLCAVSGGLDSMVLLDLLFRFCFPGGEAEEGNAAPGGRREEKPLIALHFNHHLRPAADTDEAFVRDWCAARDIPFIAGRGDVRVHAAREGLSIEEAARAMRYAFLREEMEKRKGSCLCTAHHMEDNAETVLWNLIRGTGIKGLSGIPAFREGICRPLLDVTREEIAAYAAARKIPHTEDETNADPDAAARNFLRHRVFPLLLTLNPKAREHIHSAALRLRALDGELDREAARRSEELIVRGGQVSLPLAALSGAGEEVRARMIFLMSDALGAGRRDYGAVHLAALSRLTGDPSGGEKRLDLPHGITARRTADTLILERKQRSPSAAPLVPGEPLAWGAYVFTLREYSAGQALPQGDAERLILRGGAAGESVMIGSCRGGERLRLPGASGRRTVKRLCLDRGISLTERERLPAVYINGCLAAVWGIGADAAFAADAPPCRVVTAVIRESGTTEIQFTV